MQEYAKRISLEGSDVVYFWGVSSRKNVCYIVKPWLDTIFKGQCLPSSSLNYVAIKKKKLEKFATAVVSDKDKNLSWSGLQWHRSCQSNEITPLPILLPAIFLGTGNCSYKIVNGSFFLQYGRLDVLEVKAESVRTLSRYFGMKFLSLEIG